MQMKSDKGHGKQEREAREAERHTKSHRKLNFPRILQACGGRGGQQGVKRGLTKTHFQ